MNDDPKACAVSLGMDALRICIGQKPKRWTLRDIVRWMRLMERAAK